MRFGRLARDLLLTLDSCQRCHSHKIKCSGDLPCSKCRSVGCADECAYATRDRQVKVSEKYVSKSIFVKLSAEQKLSRAVRFGH